MAGSGGGVPAHPSGWRKIGPPSGANRWRIGRHRDQWVDLGGRTSRPVSGVSFSRDPWRPVSGCFLQCFIGARFPSYSEPTQSETENRPWWSLSQTEYQFRLVILEWDGGEANVSQPAHDRSRRFVRSNRHTGCPHFLNEFDSDHVLGALPGRNAIGFRRLHARGVRIVSYSMGASEKMSNACQRCPWATTSGNDAIPQEKISMKLSVPKHFSERYSKDERTLNVFIKLLWRIICVVQSSPGARAEVNNRLSLLGRDSAD